MASFLLTSLTLAGVTALAGRLVAPWSGGRLPSSAVRPATRGLLASPYAEQIERVAAQQGLDPLLVAAVVEVESGFDPVAVSHRGARGLMQIIPSTWRELNPASTCRGAHAPPAREPGCIYEPGANLTAGARHLRGLLDRFHGDAVLALAAYNAGQGAVERAAGPGQEGAVPALAETRRYTELVLDRWAEARLGLGFTQVRDLTRLLMLARWLLVGDLLVLAAICLARPAWAGGRWR